MTNPDQTPDNEALRRRVAELEAQLAEALHRAAVAEGVAAELTRVGGPVTLAAYLRDGGATPDEMAAAGVSPW